MKELVNYIHEIGGKKLKITQVEDASDRVRPLLLVVRFQRGDKIWTHAIHRDSLDSDFDYDATLREIKQAIFPAGE